MRVLLFCFILALPAGCGTLKTAQTENVKAFGKSARTLSAVPGQLYTGIASYRRQLKLIEVSTVYRPEKLMEQLDNIAVINSRFQGNAEEIDASAAMIDSYAECLLALTDAAYEKEWKGQSGELSLKLTTAFNGYNKTFGGKLPASMGSFIGSVVTQIGSIKLRSLQRRYLKSFVDTGAVIINDICTYFTITMGQTLNNELGSLDNQFSNVMTTFYDNVYAYQKQQNVNPFDYLKYYNPLYLEMKEKLEALHRLQQRTIAAMGHIKTAHQGLQNAVDIRLPTELLAEVKELYAATNEIKLSLKPTKTTRED